MSLEKTLNCVGFYGFGGGWAVGLREGPMPPTGTELYCGRCPLAKECWTKHRARTAEIFPAATEAFDLLCAEFKGPEAVKKWTEENKCVDPYTAVMLDNLYDGSAFVNKCPPKDRGPFTIKFPFGGEK